MKSLRLLILFVALRVRSAECEGFFLWPELSEQGNLIPFRPLEFEQTLPEKEYDAKPTHSVVFELRHGSLWHKTGDRVDIASSTNPTFNLLIPTHYSDFTMSYGEYYIFFFRNRQAQLDCWARINGPYVVHRSNNAVFDRNITGSAVGRHSDDKHRNGKRTFPWKLSISRVYGRDFLGDSGFFIFTFSQLPKNNLLPDSFGEIYSGPTKVHVDEAELEQYRMWAVFSSPDQSQAYSSAELVEAVHRPVKRGLLEIANYESTKMPKEVIFDARRSNDLPGAILLCLKQVSLLENGANFRCDGYAKTDHVLSRGGVAIYSPPESTNQSSEGIEGKGKETTISPQPAVQQSQTIEPSTMALLRELLQKRKIGQTTRYPQPAVQQPQRNKPSTKQSQPKETSVAQLGLGNQPSENRPLSRNALLQRYLLKRKIEGTTISPQPAVQQQSQTIKPSTKSTLKELLQKRKIGQTTMSPPPVKRLKETSVAQLGMDNQPSGDRPSSTTALLKFLQKHKIEGTTISPQPAVQQPPRNKPSTKHSYGEGTQPFPVNLIKSLQSPTIFSLWVEKRI